MDKEEFRQKRIKERAQLLETITKTFQSFSPVAIHQFGSGSNGYKDEFSDIDIWITFKDGDIGNILNQLGKIFDSIAPVLVRHYSRSWSPVGGSANSVIQDTEFGPFVVDYYISKFSEAVIKENSKVLFGDDSLKRGAWRLNKEVDKNMHDSHTLKKDINLLLDLIFISIKGIVRKKEGDDFVNTLRTVHRNFRRRYDGTIKRRQISLSFRSDYRLLSDLYHMANKNQRKAISKIRRYAKKVEALYA